MALIATVQVMPAIAPVRDGACRVCHRLLDEEGHDPACGVPAFEADMRALKATLRGGSL